MPWNPNIQLSYPEGKRKHCEKCGILLADGYVTEKGRPVYVCDPCTAVTIKAVGE